MYLIGIIIFIVFLTLLTFFVTTPLAFIDLPSLIVIIVLTFPILLASGLLPDFIKGFQLMGKKENTFTEIELRRIIISLKLTILSVVASGFIGSMVGGIATLSSSVSKENLAPNLSVASLTFLYSLIIALILFPVYARARAIKSTLE